MYCQYWTQWKLINFDPNSVKANRGYVPSETCNSEDRYTFRIFSGRRLDIQWCKVSSRGQRRLRSDCANAQADLSPRWAHMSEGTFSHVVPHEIFISDSVVVKRTFIFFKYPCIKHSGNELILTRIQVKYTYKIYLLTGASVEDSDQPTHPCGLIRVFVMRSLNSQGCKVSSDLEYLHCESWSESSLTQSLTVHFLTLRFALVRLSKRPAFVSWLPIFAVRLHYSRLSLSRISRDYEILQDIRTSTYQICRIEEKMIRTTTFNKYICNWTLEVRDVLKILWKRGEIAP